MTGIDAFGPTIANTIRICWWICGISFGIYIWKITNKKIDIGLIVISCFGPIGWLAVLFMNLCKPIIKKHQSWKQIIATLSFICAILVIIIPTFIFGLYK